MIVSCCSSCSIQPEPMMRARSSMAASLFASMMSQRSSLSKSHLLLSSSLVCSSGLSSENSSVNLLKLSIKWSSFSCLLSGFDKKSLKLDFISSSPAVMLSFCLQTDLNRFVMLLAYLSSASFHDLYKMITTDGCNPMTGCSAAGYSSCCSVASCLLPSAATSAA